MSSLLPQPQLEPWVFFLVVVNRYLELTSEILVQALHYPLALWVSLLFLRLPKQFFQVVLQLLADLFLIQLALIH